jgi:PAS domain S-box-containing protein
MRGDFRALMILKRFLIIAVVGIVLSFSLLTYLVARKESDLFEKSDEEKLWLVTQSLTAALKSSMVQGRPAIVKNMVDRLNERGPLKLSVYRRDGALAFGQGDIAISREMLSAPKQMHLHTGATVAFLDPVFNEPACYNCHPPEVKTLGIVAIEMPLTVFTEGINGIERRLVLFGILLVFSACAAVFLVAKKTLLDPISRINEGAELIKGGELGHRISLRKNDELGALASTFNEMAESVEKSHDHLEKAVKQKTGELKVIAELSTQVFRGNISLHGIISRFLDAISEEMGFGYAALCLVNKETGMLSQEFTKGLAEGLCSGEISLASDHPFITAIREATPSVKKSSDVGLPAVFSDTVIIPILSHQRKRCREINLCALESCPAFANKDERCWLTSETLCRSPQSVAGAEKIFGCLHCGAFPVLGVLVAGKDGKISKSSMHSLAILASQIASAIENRRFIEEKKKDIAKLIDLHDISVETLQNLEDNLPKSIVSSAVVFSGTDGAILWLKGEGGDLYAEESFHIEKDLIPRSVPVENSFVGRAITEGRPVETLEMRNVLCMSNVIARHDFLYAASVPLKFKNRAYGCLTLFQKKDFLMTDSEKAAILLFAGQAAAALNTARLYEEIGKSEYSYRTLAENLPGIVYRIFVREEGRMRLFNDVVRQMTGYSASELHGGEICPIENLVLPEDRARIIPIIKKAVLENRPFQIDYRIKSKGGDVRYCAERGKPVQGPDRKPLYIDGVILDITDQKKAEEEMGQLFSSLRAEKEFSEAIFNCTASGILVLDREGHLLKINSMGREILQADKAGLTGRKITEIYPETKAMLVEKSDMAAEITISLPDNTSIPVGFNTSAILNPPGGREGTIVVFRDLSQIKKLQAELRKKEHFDTMGKVISGVAHEVRNPLFGISSIGQILDRELDSPQHKPLIQAMLRETDRMKRLVEELLLYTKPSRMEIREFDLGALMEELTHYAKAKREDIALSVNIPPLLTVKADRDKLTQVLLNLLNNSVDAARGVIGVSAKTAGSSVQIRVEDDGPGIRPEDIDRVFEPFFTTKKGGTGLGLPICRKIVEDHGGTIEVISSPGNGTSVTISLTS